MSSLLNISSQYYELRSSIIAGSAAGCASITFCHPIDVIRTKIQLSKSFETTASILKNETLISLYKGFLGPFFAQGVYKSVLFTTSSLSHKLLFRNEPSYSATFICGVIAGILNSFIVCPVELIRTHSISSGNIASNHINNNNNNTTPISFSRIISQYTNNISSSSTKAYTNSNRIQIFRLWQSILPTILRDAPGVGVYFVTFQYAKDIGSSFLLYYSYTSNDIDNKGNRNASLKANSKAANNNDIYTDINNSANNNKINRKKNNSKAIIPATLSYHTQFVIKLVSASVAGIAYWVWALPLDTIKTNIEYSLYQRNDNNNDVNSNSNVKIKSTVSDSNINNIINNSNSSSANSTTLKSTDSINLVRPKTTPTTTSPSLSSTSNLFISLQQIYHITRNLIKETGSISRLYRAWAVAFGRGIPSAAITLTTYDVVMDYLQKQR